MQKIKIGVLVCILSIFTASGFAASETLNRTEIFLEPINTVGLSIAGSGVGFDIGAASYTGNHFVYGLETYGVLGQIYAEGIFGKYFFGKDPYNGFFLSASAIFYQGETLYGMSYEMGPISLRAGYKLNYNKETPYGGYTQIAAGGSYQVGSGFGYGATLSSGWKIVFGEDKTRGFYIDPSVWISLPSSNPVGYNLYIGYIF